jgi:tRNA pseudouridine32 synthase/23S rRNA pseudouridine746 synthase/23S rRNA pseudouridine1911/1915/1917 synthase
MVWTNPKAQTLLEALKECFPDSSNNSIRSWIKEERVKIGRKAAFDTKQMVQPGQKIELGPKKHYMEEGIEILYEDDYMIALYKPSGILSVASNYDPQQNVHNFLKKRFHNRRVYPVHRLDREVSGVMLFAYQEEAASRLKKQFEEHSILRQYIAIVEGELEPSQGTWQSYLYEDKNYYVRSVENPSLGQLATTHYKVIHRRKGISTLLVTLETGRKNQIRVHCKEAGHPILGDKKYGSSFESSSRVALHAYKLGIQHPILEKPMTFERKAPLFFERYLP